ncbi:MAG: response regulator [Candidatus Omnitrophota bacterium]|nr:response regulator [Candidatus Omnitrophota bacterium]
MMTKADRPVILIIDDEPDILKVLVKRLGAAGYAVVSVQDAREGIVRARDLMPALIILDIMMPHLDGMSVKRQLNDDPSIREIPVLFLSAKGQVHDKIAGFQLGADDYITKPFEINELLARIGASIARKRKYEANSTIDGLTGLGNVHVFHKQLALFFGMSRRYHRPMSMIVLDLDSFKQINDTYGHKTGDLVLKAVGRAMLDTFRTSDVLVRYGGDEFVALLPETDEDKARRVGERLQMAFEKIGISVGPGVPPITAHASLGIATITPEMATGDELFELADKRMYEFKRMEGGTSSRAKHILVIEDESDIAKAIAFRLRKIGYRVTVSADGEAGMEVAKRLKPDLIVLDLMLPKLSGEDICKAIREDDDEVFARTPIVMLTAKDGEIDRIIGRVLGANMYMVKPFESEELLQNVTLLAGRP